MSEVRVGLIGGSGLGGVLEADGNGIRHAVDTPFGSPSGDIVETNWAGLPVFILPRHGPGHLLNPSKVPYRANIFAMKQLGVTHLIASGAVGSLRDGLRPRDLVLPDQVIDKTTSRPTTFYDCAAVHVEFAEPFCPVLRQLLVDAAGRMEEGNDGGSRMKDRNTGETSTPPPSSTLDLRPSVSPFTTHALGCYVAMEGPAFSTRAESLMHRLWGGDLIGMTAMPEAKLAREAEISYALVALVTDYDCWKARPTGAGAATGDAQSLLDEIIGNLKAASANAIALMRRAVELLAERRDTLPASPAHRALELGIWSDKTKIPTEEVDRLHPLWGKYFPSHNATRAV